jgi:hypothetical protein
MYPPTCFTEIPSCAAITEGEIPCWYIDLILAASESFTVSALTVLPGCTEAVEAFTAAVEVIWVAAVETLPLDAVAVEVGSIVVKVVPPCSQEISAAIRRR